MKRTVKFLISQGDTNKSSEKQSLIEQGVPMVKTDLTVTQLVKDAENGSFALPFFQRDFVWEKKDVTMFLDSMSKHWPTGSIILWDRPRVRGRKFGFLKGNPKEITTDVLVLDGQQRITTLLLLHRDGRIDLQAVYGRTTPYYFFFDLEESKFIASREESLAAGRYIDVEDILRGRIEVRRILKKYRRNQTQQLLIQDLKALADYKFPIVRTHVTTDEDAIDIFNRVNTSGKRVDKLELAFARLRDKEHTVSRKITAFQSEWVREGFDLTPRVLINSFLIVQHINDKEYYVTTRNADSQIKNYLNYSPRVLTDLENVFQRIKSALRFVKHVGFDSDQFLPSENVIAALAGYFERNDTKHYNLSTRRSNSLRRWLFRTLVFGRYTYTTNFEQDLEELQDSGRLPDSKGGPSYSHDGLIALMYAIGRRRGMTDYHGDEITWADTMRVNRVIHVDHIYPYSRLTREPILAVAGEDGEEFADDIGNKAFAVGESNISKNKKFLGREVCSKVVGQWLDGFSLLEEADYRKMCESKHALRQNWRDIRNFIEERHGRIIRDIKQEIR